jgi:hypothetical protein
MAAKTDRDADRRTETKILCVTDCRHARGRCFPK